MRDKKREKKGICKRCGRWGMTQWHHIFGGPKRRASDTYDLVIELCPDCHRELHDEPGSNLYYKQEAQRAFEQKKSRTVWMNLMHRNYLED